MNEEVITLQFRQYFHKELPALLGTTKWNLNRDLRPYRQRLGKRTGNRWRFEQVMMILDIFGIHYQVDKH